MNYTRLFTAAALAMILLAGCKEKIDPPEPGPEPPAPPVRPESFAATVENISGVPQSAWKEGTGLTVFFEPAADGRTFLIGGDPAKISEEGFNDYYKALAAVYPASFTSTFTKDGLTIELPQVQSFVEGGIAPEAMPLAALGDTTGNLSFKTPCSVVAVEVQRSLQIREIRLTSNGDEALWGTMAIAADPAQFPAATMREKASPDRNALILKVSETGSGSNGTEAFVTGPNSTVTGGTIPANGLESTSTYYFVVPAGSLQQGCRLTIIDERGGYMQQDIPTASTARATCAKAGNMAYKDASENVEIPDVLNKAFYKDIYMNSGLFLTTNDTLPVADFLNLSIEHMMDARNSPTPAD